MKRLIWILWPSFIVGGIAEAVFFTLFDPADLSILGQPVDLSRTTIYSLGFFLFWAFAAASSAFTCFLQRSAVDVNRLSPLESDERPGGCPKQPGQTSPDNS